MIIEMDLEKEDTVDVVVEDEVPDKKEISLYFFLIYEKLYIA